MPQAILLQDVEKLGEKGDVVDVGKPGYLRNYLIPRKLAQQSTPAASRPPRRVRRPPSAPCARPRERASENAALLTKTVLTISAQAGEDGRLFGSVTSQDIVDAIKAARGDPGRSPQGPSRGPDPQRGHAHGRRRGRRWRDRDGQDHGRRRALTLRAESSRLSPEFAKSFPADKRGES